MKQYLTLKKYLHNENARRLFGNFLSLSTIQVIGYLFPLITMPYLARVIGVQGFGAIAFGAAVIAYFSAVTDWGFKYTAVRDISINREDNVKISLIFSHVMGCKILLTCLSALILWVLIEIIPLFNENKTILWATFLLVPGYILFPDWLFQGMEEMKFITIMNLVSKSIFTLLVLCLIKKQSDYVLEPIIQACGFIVSGCIGFIYGIKHFKLHIVKPSLNGVFSMMKGSWNMFISQFFPTLHQIFSMIMLESMAGSRATGIFSAGHRFISIIDALSQTLSRAFYPFLARRMDKHAFYVKVSAGISIIMSLFLLICARILIYIFYTPEFDNAATVIQIMSCSPFFLFLLNSYGNNGLSLIGKERVLRNIGVWCTIIGLFIAFIAIYFWGSYGMALAVVSTWGLRGISCYYFYNKYKEVSMSKISY